MKKKLFVLGIALMAGFYSAPTLDSQENQELKTEVVVIGTQIPSEFSHTTRNITIITKEEISKAPINSLADLIRFIPGVDLKQRGTWGVQADISIRGSSFSQVLVLVDGIKVYDPQTAHHNLDIPVPLTEIERIEVLNGQGSAVYGENAFGGVINIVTKKAGGGISGGISYGEFKTIKSDLSLSHMLGKIRHRLTAEYSRSDGFAYDRDFNTLNFLSNSRLDLPSGKFELQLGYLAKEFGAANFYAAYPSKEWTHTGFISLQGKVNNTRIRTFFRRHTDRFMLDITRPTWYVNRHKTYSYGGEASTFFNLQEHGRLALGGEIRKDQITSEGLGDHAYGKAGVFLEYEASLLPWLFINAGLRSDIVSRYPVQLSPNLSLGVILSSRLKLRSSLGRAFRIPSFTELYYNSPANLGSSQLNPEKNFSWEIGLDYFPHPNIAWETTFFSRYDRDLIAWIKTEDQAPWQATNIRALNFYGIETKLKIGTGFSLGYTYLESPTAAQVDYLSKYVHHHLQHHLTVSIHTILPQKIALGITGMFKKKPEAEEFLVLDARISRKFSRWEISITATNLLNTYYQEIPGIAMPGRWISAGIRWLEK